MSDFSVTARCPFCGGRFCPDDGGCGCWQEDEYYRDREVKDGDVDMVADSGDCDSVVVRGVLHRDIDDLPVEGDA